MGHENYNHGRFDQDQISGAYHMGFVKDKYWEAIGQILFGLISFLILTIIACALCRCCYVIFKACCNKSGVGYTLAGDDFDECKWKFAPFVLICVRLKINAIYLMNCEMEMRQSTPHLIVRVLYALFIVIRRVKIQLIPALFVRALNLHKSVV